MKQNGSSAMEHKGRWDFCSVSSDTLILIFWSNHCETCLSHCHSQKAKPEKIIANLTSELQGPLGFYDFAFPWIQQVLLK